MQFRDGRKAGYISEKYGQFLFLPAQLGPFSRAYELTHQFGRNILPESMKPFLHGRNGIAHQLDFLHAGGNVDFFLQVEALDFHSGFGNEANGAGDAPRRSQRPARRQAQA